MQRAFLFSRWDPVNPTNIIAAVLLGWAWWVYHRPFLPELLPSYSAFTQVLPWALWGWFALGFALLLLFTPRGSVWRLGAHLLASLYLGAVAYAFGAGAGGTSGVSTNTILSYVSLVLMARTAVHLAASSVWWARLVDSPPRWLRRLARIDDEEQRGGV
ncbi:hypothetical protein GO986_08520 [Deinococcus sp. HMF7620]|uniref:Uncharacterized protein n=1 Tax=Deinococcus arboris TaxID=2682977 RepID=A0A7C9M603_9DEIO|nr:hypothetical protein [Deinococcus arboris]MVN86805.1 hypothetical protein [Deinococcus arboris]